jgi:hypothetical protein
MKLELVPHDQVPRALFIEVVEVINTMVSDGGVISNRFGHELCDRTKHTKLVERVENILHLLPGFLIHEQR